MNTHRIPLPTQNPLNKNQDIQVNHCRMPDCDNFGIPANVEHVKQGRPSNTVIDDDNKDSRYTLDAEGLTPAIKCKSCHEVPPIKSNNGIASEITRLTTYLQQPEDKCCPNDDCDNHTISINANPKLYTKKGHHQDTGNPIRQCKDCKTRFSIPVIDPIRIHPKNQYLAADILSRVANKSAIRRTLKGIDRFDANHDLYYSILRFIHRRCNRLLGGVERQMLDGGFALPKTLILASDIQEYYLNWSNRIDKRNPVFSTIGTVDKDSRYLFGLDVNYDKDADAFAINQQSALNGDFTKSEPYREYGQYWLAGDELHKSRTLHHRVGATKSKAIIQQIQETYTNAQSREDIEDPEKWALDPNIQTPKLSKGLQVHIPYTSYAHFFIMQQLFKNAGVENIQYSMDCESMLRAAFLSAFKDEVKQGKAHAFYTKHSIHLTVGERERRVAIARSTLDKFRQSLPDEQQKHAKQLLMQHNLKAHTQPFGKWSDNWVTHPLPTMNEPDKRVCCLTSTKSIDEATQAQMYLNAGLGAIDNVFQLTRRHINALERPIGTANKNSPIWNGYAPYNPAMLQQYLDIFRTTHNYCNPGKDGKTPAMRLGLTDRVMTYDDVLWPGQIPPQAPVKTEQGYSPLTASLTQSHPQNSKKESIIPATPPLTPAFNPSP